MQRIATVAVYDALDQVVISAHVREYDGMLTARNADTWSVSTQVRGSGEENGTRWLRDALVALAETL